MKVIYLDNACTSFPKPKCVAKAVCDFINNLGVNSGRSSYDMSYQVGDIMYETRCLIKEIFNAENENNVIFTKNITESLNIVLKGLLKPNDHVLVSSLDHNAIMRPINELQIERNISYTRIPCDQNGNLLLTELKSIINKNTKACVMQHASNVFGNVNDIKTIGRFCKEHNIFFILDSAQSAGVLDIDMKENHIDAFCFTGHKSLLGPQGIGGFILTNEMVPLVNTFITGGTGSKSHEEIQPDFTPDKYESGTMNLPNIAGLNASLKYITKERTIQEIREHELSLAKFFLDELKTLEDQKILQIIGNKTLDNRLGVISITSTLMDNANLAYMLEKNYGILTRVGLHCAPNAHKSLNSFPEGTIRFSIGPFNTLDEIKTALRALSKITNK